MMTHVDWGLGMGTEVWHMDAAFSAACLATAIIFGLSIFLRINENFAARTNDPVVERAFAVTQSEMFR